MAAAAATSTPAAPPPARPATSSPTGCRPGARRLVLKVSLDEMEANWARSAGELMLADARAWSSWPAGPSGSYRTLRPLRGGARATARDSSTATCRCSPCAGPPRASARDVGRRGRGPRGLARGARGHRGAAGCRTPAWLRRC
jgi:hypothetical protein